MTWADPFGVPVLSSASTASAFDGGMALTADGRLVPVKENTAPLAWAGRGAILPDGRTLFANHNNSGPAWISSSRGKESYCDTKLLTTLEKPGLAWLGSAAVTSGTLGDRGHDPVHRMQPAGPSSSCGAARPLPATRPGGRLFERADAAARWAILARC